MHKGESRGHHKNGEEANRRSFSGSPWFHSAPHQRLIRHHTRDSRHSQWHDAGSQDVAMEIVVRSIIRMGNRLLPLTRTATLTWKFAPSAGRQEWCTTALDQHAKLRSQLPLQQCKGCYLCIARCEECGICIDGDDYEETFCLEILCQSCWLHLPKCSECNRAGCSRHVEDLQISSNGSFTCDFSLLQT